MKFSRIVLKRTNKTNDNHFFMREIGSGLLFVFLLPYVCACLWGHAGEEKEMLWQDKDGGQTAAAEAYTVDAVLDWGIWRLPLEEYLVYKLAETMPEEYEEETLKAQAVLLRTEFFRKVKNQEAESLMVEEKGLTKWYGAGRETEELTKYREAVEQTAGCYLCYEGEPILVSYFKVSNGKTRDAGEVWHTDACPYLAGVSSSQDKSSPEFRSTVTVSKREFLEKMKRISEGGYAKEEPGEELVLSYDSAGYVTDVSGYCDGDTFRRLFGLNSASFTIEQREDEVVFEVTGVGHGFGMSQYGANCKAVNGEAYQEILKEYFLGTELAKIE